MTRRHLRHLLLAVVALACGTTTAAAPAAADETVAAGPAQATLRAEPWGLTFSAAGVTLDEHGGPATRSAGRLGFRAGGTWFHATRATTVRKEGDTVTATVATDDPAGRTFKVRLGPDGEGILRLEAAVGGPSGADAVGIGFDAGPGERYLGFGERSNAVDQSGNEVENYVAEGPYQPGEDQLIRLFVPPWGYRDRVDSTYYPMPWLLSTRGYGVLVDNYDTSRFRLRNDDPSAWSLEVDATALALRFFAGPRPADVLRRLTERTGRQPKPQAPWFHGPWVHTGQENTPPPERERAEISALRDGDAPVSAVETHMRYLPCGVHRPVRDNEKARAQFFHSQGLPMIGYFNPEICRDYSEAFDEAARRGVLTKNEAGQPYVYSAYVGDRTPPQTPVGQVDFTAPGAQEFWDGLMNQAVDDGKDGWMEDFGEYTPPDSVHANGMPGPQMHNRYPVDYHCAGYDFARRAPRPISRHIRSGWTGAARCAQVVWGGDPTTTWGFDGLDSAVKNGLTMGLSGVSIWGSDIGGFFALGDNRLTPELLDRWVQFGAVSGVMRTKHGGVAIPAKERPQVYDRDRLPNWRRWAKFRTQIYPYIAGADRVYAANGMPLMRHLALAYPDDVQAAGQEREFMFGPDLLAAPVVEPGARRRELYLPRGRWIDLWRSVAYDTRGGGLRLLGARAAGGGRNVTLPAPQDELPLLARAGTVLPLLPPDVDTLADYGDGTKGLVRLRDRQSRMELLALPRGKSFARFGDRDSLRSVESRNRWALKLRGARTRRYALQASLATLRKPFTPCAVTVAGRRVRFRYDRRTRVLRTSVKLRDGVVAVRACR